MTRTSSEGSAQIIQFPAGGRSAWKKDHAAAKTESGFGTEPSVKLSGGAGYHDEAIQDAARGRTS